MNKRIVISGCSGGGKSTLLEALRSEGYRTVQEAGRQIVEIEAKQDGEALPWRNMPLFLERAIELAYRDFEKASKVDGLIFFDRSLVDLVLAYEHFTGNSKFNDLIETNRYAQRVYFTPPWPEIYVNDSERQHSFEDARDEYHRLVSGYPKFGYHIDELPKTSVKMRVKYIVDAL